MGYLCRILFTIIILWLKNIYYFYEKERFWGFGVLGFWGPTWWLKLIFININSEFELEIRVVPWFLLFLIALVFSLKKLNSALYKNLIGDITDPSQPQAMAAFSDVPDVEVVGRVDDALKDIALDVANKLAALGFQFDSLGYSEIAGT